MIASTDISNGSGSDTAWERLAELFDEIASTMDEAAEYLEKLAEERMLLEPEVYGFVRNVMFESTGLRSPTVQRQLVPL